MALLLDAAGSAAAPTKRAEPLLPLGSYQARANETVDAIAEAIYGERRLGAVLSEVNRLDRTAEVRAGQVLKVPSALNYRVKRGDTVEAIALRSLGDRRRAKALILLAALPNGDRLKEGQEISIPFLHHHVVKPAETLETIARTYYGTTSWTERLVEFNFKSSATIAPGEQLVLPMPHFASKLLPPGAAPSSESAREGHVLPTVLVPAQRALFDGDGARAIELVETVLSSSRASEAERTAGTAIQASALLALGRPSEALACVKLLVDRQPSVSFDEALVSPKVRALLERVRPVK
jgi:LysM repeat protein